MGSLIEEELRRREAAAQGGNARGAPSRARGSKANGVARRSARAGHRGRIPFTVPSHRVPMLSRMRLMFVVGAVVCLATACTATPAAAPAANSKPGTSSAPSATPTRHASATPTPKPKPKPKPVPHVTMHQVRTADGVKVTVAVFHGPVRYVLHTGSADPALSAALVTASPAVGGTERKQLLAAFNGGFKLSAGAGGYEQEGHVISPLLTGYASLIIDRSGRARMAAWGYGAPARGEAVYSVRQNLQLLVEHGQPTAAAADWYAWGATLGGGEYVARSALGEDASGDLLYAGSMSASPEDLAQALADHGARIGMELDINPEWVQLDVASRPGGPLTAKVPGQYRPADQYLLGWSRDFITVLGG
jgi:hypothetical protein